MDTRSGCFPVKRPTRSVFGFRCIHMFAQKVVLPRIPSLELTAKKKNLKIGLPKRIKSPKHHVQGHKLLVLRSVLKQFGDLVILLMVQKSCNI